MSDTIKLIETKIAELQDKLKQNGSYINDITAAVEKLLADKATTLNAINIITGAIQAYNETLNHLKSQESVNSSDNTSQGS